MMRAALAILLLIPAPWAAGQAKDQRGLPPVLRRALAAANTLRLTGRRTVTVLEDGQSIRHEEIIMRDGPRLRIEFPSRGAYAGQVIVEDGKQRKHYLPANDEIRILPTRREEALARIRRWARNGKVSTEKGARIAGLPTVEVVARDASGNVVQRLDVNPASGLVLRRRVYSATGSEMGGFVYTKVNLNPEPFDPSLFRIERRGAKVTTPWDELRRLAKRSGFAPLGLPESTGFRLDTARLAKLPGGSVLLQTYMGPGGRLSLYQLKSAVNPERLRRQAKRGVQTLSWSADGRHFVLLGPQDQATLAKLKAAVGR
ncbi:hypothetical protein EON82_17115 [bacterium]|nr:MAG: hypothetical protein EON82_17115 [bacterium]